MNSFSSNAYARVKCQDILSHPQETALRTLHRGLCYRESCCNPSSINISPKAAERTDNSTCSLNNIYQNFFVTQKSKTHYSDSATGNKLQKLVTLRKPAPLYNDCRHVVSPKSLIPQHFVVKKETDTISLKGRNESAKGRWHNNKLLTDKFASAKFSQPKDKPFRATNNNQGPLWLPILKTASNKCCNVAAAPVSDDYLSCVSTPSSLNAKHHSCNFKYNHNGRPNSFSPIATPKQNRLTFHIPSHNMSPPTSPIDVMHQHHSARNLYNLEVDRKSLLTTLTHKGNRTALTPEENVCRSYTTRLFKKPIFSFGVFKRKQACLGPYVDVKTTILSPSNVPHSNRPDSSSLFALDTRNTFIPNECNDVADKWLTPANSSGHPCEMQHMLCRPRRGSAVTMTQKLTVKNSTDGVLRASQPQLPEKVASSVNEPQSCPHYLRFVTNHHSSRKYEDENVLRLNHTPGSCATSKHIDSKISRRIKAQTNNLSWNFSKQEKKKNNIQENVISELSVRSDFKKPSSTIFGTKNIMTKCEHGGLSCWCKKLTFLTNNQEYHNDVYTNKENLHESKLILPNSWNDSNKNVPYNKYLDCSSSRQNPLPHFCYNEYSKIQTPQQNVSVNLEGLAPTHMKLLHSYTKKDKKYREDPLTLINRKKNTPAFFNKEVSMNNNNTHYNSTSSYVPMKHLTIPEAEFLQTKNLTNVSTVDDKQPHLIYKDNRKCNTIKRHNIKHSNCNHHTQWYKDTIPMMGKLDCRAVEYVSSNNSHQLTHGNSKKSPKNVTNDDDDDTNMCSRVYHTQNNPAIWKPNYKSILVRPHRRRTLYDSRTRYLLRAGVRESGSNKSFRWAYKYNRQVQYAVEHSWESPNCRQRRQCTQHCYHSDSLFRSNNKALCPISVTNAHHLHGIDCQKKELQNKKKISRPHYPRTTHSFQTYETRLESENNLGHNARSSSSENGYNPSELCFRSTQNHHLPTFWGKHHSYQTKMTPQQIVLPHLLDRQKKTTDFTKLSMSSAYKVNQMLLSSEASSSVINRTEQNDMSKRKYSEQKIQNSYDGALQSTLCSIAADIKNKKSLDLSNNGYDGCININKKKRDLTVYPKYFRQKRRQSLLLKALLSPRGNMQLPLQKCYSILNSKRPPALPIERHAIHDQFKTGASLLATAPLDDATAAAALVLSIRNLFRSSKKFSKHSRRIASLFPGMPVPLESLTQSTLDTELTSDLPLPLESVIGSQSKISENDIRPRLLIALPTRNLDADFATFGYEHLYMLSHGPNGRTHVVRSLQDNEIWVAKVVDLSKLTMAEAAVAKLEAEYLQRLRHPFILRFKESFGTNTSLIIITEYCRGGDLFSRVESAAAAQAAKGLTSEEALRHQVQSATDSSICSKPSCRSSPLSRRQRSSNTSSSWFPRSSTFISQVQESPCSIASCLYPRRNTFSQDISLELDDSSNKCPISHNDEDDQEEETLSPPLIIKWITQLALGLQYMHSQKILHCDLKSSNIFLTEEGTAKIGDLGIAREMGRAVSTRGTPNYMSPEICSGREVTDKADSWALGCVLYELVFKRHAFDEVPVDFTTWTMSSAVGKVSQEIERRLPCIEAEIYNLGVVSGVNICSRNTLYSQKSRSFRCHKLSAECNTHGTVPNKKRKSIHLQDDVQRLSTSSSIIIDDTKCSSSNNIVEPESMDGNGICNDIKSQQLLNNKHIYLGPYSIPLKYKTCKTSSSSSSSSSYLKHNNNKQKNINKKEFSSLMSLCSINKNSSLTSESTFTQINNISQNTPSVKLPILLPSCNNNNNNKLTTIPPVVSSDTETLTQDEMFLKKLTPTPVEFFKSSKNVITESSPASIIAASCPTTPPPSINMSNDDIITLSTSDSCSSKGLFKETKNNSTTTSSSTITKFSIRLIYRLLSALLRQNPEERPSLQNVLEMLYSAEYLKDDEEDYYYNDDDDDDDNSEFKKQSFYNLSACIKEIDDNDGRKKKKKKKKNEAYNNLFKSNICINTKNILDDHPFINTDNQTQNVHVDTNNDFQSQQAERSHMYLNEEQQCFNSSPNSKNNNVNLLCDSLKCSYPLMNHTLISTSSPAKPQSTEHNNSLCPPTIEHITNSQIPNTTTDPYCSIMHDGIIITSAPTPSSNNRIWYNNNNHYHLNKLHSRVVLEDDSSFLVHNTALLDSNHIDQKKNSNVNSLEEDINILTTPSEYFESNIHLQHSNYSNLCELNKSTTTTTRRNMYVPITTLPQLVVPAQSPHNNNNNNSQGTNETEIDVLLSPTKQQEGSATIIKRKRFTKSNKFIETNDCNDNDEDDDDDDDNIIDTNHNKNKLFLRSCKFRKLRRLALSRGIVSPQIRAIARHLHELPQRQVRFIHKQHPIRRLKLP